METARTSETSIKFCFPRHIVTIVRTSTLTLLNNFGFEIWTQILPPCYASIYLAVLEDERSPKLNGLLVCIYRMLPLTVAERSEP
jgi:hypothetical protein